MTDGIFGRASLLLHSRPHSLLFEKNEDSRLSPNCPASGRLVSLCLFTAGCWDPRALGTFDASCPSRSGRFSGIEARRRGDDGDGKRDETDALRDDRPPRVSRERSIEFIFFLGGRGSGRLSDDQLASFLHPVDRFCRLYCRFQIESGGSEREERIRARRKIED